MTTPAVIVYVDVKIYNKKNNKKGETICLIYPEKIS